MTRHLLSIQDLSADELKQLVEQGQALSETPGQEARVLSGETVAMLFYEPSTRTRCSFEMAARRLGAEVLNLDIDTTSVSKGETVNDTVKTLAAMGVRLFVMRHGDKSVITQAAAALPRHCHLINAGAGTQDHPSQTLLDLLTLARAGQDIQALDLSIVGDLRHSRVANSMLQALTLLGCQRLRLGGPAAFLPQDPPAWVERHDTLADSIQGAAVIMALRIQRERMAKESLGRLEAYHQDWGLSEPRLKQWAANALVMHPGPMNRGVEIDDEVADGPRSLILKQVENGVPARMAALRWLNER